MHTLDDTIAAIASASGGAARGIVRLSGPDVRQCLEACFTISPLPMAGTTKWSGQGGRADALKNPSILEGLVLLPGFHSPLPCEIYLWPAGRSYTGQTVAEFHTLGSPPLLESLLKTLCAAGARLAESGEFTLRAFLSGRIDLTQAEAVLGVIDAADPRQLRAALTQLAGGLADPLHRLRDELLELLAHLEAGFDFVEEDISFIAPDEIERQLASAIERTASLLEKMSSRNVAETAVKAVLIGRPNAGKSSLFNTLTKKCGAIVSSIPGTTRDYLTAELDLDGAKCQLIDTAGIESNLPSPIGRGAGGEGFSGKVDSNDIDIVSQSATQEQHQLATILILCLDASSSINDWEKEQLEKADPNSTLIALTKIDCSSHDDRQRNDERSAWTRRLNVDRDSNLCAIATSSATGEGIELLRAELRRAICSLDAGKSEVVAGTAARCRESLAAAEQALRRALSLQHKKTGEEFVASEIRLALEELGRVVGAVYTDDVLDRIFSRFCVGK
jgi:tRNA modification GTPase